MIENLQYLNRTLDANLGHFILFSIIYVYPFLMLSLTLLGISVCRVIKCNKFCLNSIIIAYFCSLMTCYIIGTFSTVVELQVQRTSFSKEINHKGETN
jgi:hypothetical protein